MLLLLVYRDAHSLPFEVDLKYNREISLVCPGIKLYKKSKDLYSEDRCGKNENNVG